MGYTDFLFSVNDMLSLKKEVVREYFSFLSLLFITNRKYQARDAIDSVIPIMFIELGSIDAAMDKTIEFVASMIERVDSAEARLLDRYSYDNTLQQQLQKFIDGAKYYCTGNLTWR